MPCAHLGQLLSGCFLDSFQASLGSVLGSAPGTDIKPWGGDQVDTRSMARPDAPEPGKLRPRHLPLPPSWQRKAPCREPLRGRDCRSPAAAEPAGFLSHLCVCACSPPLLTLASASFSRTWARKHLVSCAGRWRGGLLPSCLGLRADPRGETGAWCGRFGGLLPSGSVTHFKDKEAEAQRS